MTCPIPYIEKLKEPFQSEAYKAHSEVLNFLTKSPYTEIDGEYVKALPNFDLVSVNEKFGNNVISLTKPSSMVIINAENTRSFQDFKIDREILDDLITKKYPNLENYLKDMNYDQKVILKNLLGQLQEIAPYFKIQTFDKILKGNDRSLTDFRDSIIQIGANANFKDITEEIFHVLVEMADPTVVKSLLDNIHHTKAYREVVAQYGEDSEYKGNDQKLRKEALGKMLSQLSSNTSLDELASTKDHGVIKQISKSLREFFSHVYSIFLKADHDDLFNLFESIMYKEVKYLPGDYTDRGVYYSKEQKYRGTEKITFISNLKIDLNDENLHTLVINGKDLLEDGFANNLFWELYDLKKAVILENDPKNINLLEKLKIYVEKGDADTEQKLTILLDGVSPIMKVQTIYQEDTFATNSNGVFDFTVINGSNVEKTTTEIKDLKSNDLNIIIPTNDESNINRTTFITVDKTNFQEGLEFLSSIVDDSFKKILTGLATKLESNLKLYRSLGIVNSTEAFSNALSDKEVGILKNIRSSSDLQQTLGNFYNAMLEFEGLFTNLTLQINNGELKLTYKQFTDINDSLKTWKRTLDYLDLKLKDAKHTNLQFQKFVDGFSRSMANLDDTIKKITTPLLADDIYNELSTFNAQLDAQLTQLDEKWKGKLTDDVAKKLYADARLELEESNKKNKVEKDLILKMLIDGRHTDIDNGLSKFNVTPIFDRWLVNIRYANDPILAYFGKMLNTIYGDADAEMRPITSDMLKLSELVIKNGGEVEVGKSLSLMVDRIYFKKEVVTETIDSKEVTYVKMMPHEIQSNEYFNEEGDRINFLIPDYIPEDSWKGETVIRKNKTEILFTYGHLSAELNNLDSKIEARLKNGVIVQQSDLNRKEELINLKKAYDEKWFHQRNLPTYTKIEENLVKAAAVENNLDENELAEKYKEFQEKLYALFNERTSLRNKSLTELTDSTSQSFLEARAAINLLTSQIATMYTWEVGTKTDEEIILSKLLSDINEEKAKYEEKTVNLNTFNKDFQLLLNKITNKNLYNTLLSAVKNGNDLKPEKEILFNLTQIHRDISYEESNDTKDISEAEMILLKDFLENAIWYKPTEEWYTKRRDIYDQLTQINTVLKNKDYASATLVDGVIEMNAKKIQHNEDYFDLINDIYIKRSDLVFSSLGEIRKYKETHKEFEGNVLLETKNVELRDRSPNSSILSLVNITGNKIKLTVSRNQAGVQETIDEISNNWDEIIQITFKYKDKFGIAAPMSKEDQILVAQLENQIYRNMSFIYPVFDMGDSITNGFYETLKAERERLASDLDALQDDVKTDSFFDEIKRELANKPSCKYEGFNKLRKLLNHEKPFKAVFKKVLDDFKIIFDENFQNLNYYSKSGDLTFENFRKTFPKMMVGGVEISTYSLSDSDIEMIQFIQRNYVRKKYAEKKDDSGKDILIIIPSYNHRIIIPKELKYLNINFDNKYISKNKVSEVITPDEYKSYNGDFKLISSDLASETIYGKSDLALREKYNKLFETPDLKEIHTKWIQDIVIKKQKEIALNDTYKIAKDSYLGYRAAYMEKQFSEYSFFGACGAFWREFAGERNAFESGEVSAESQEETDNVDKDKVKKETKKSFLQSFVDVLSKIITSSGNNPFYYKEQRFIPVDYTHRIEGEKVSNSMFRSSISYLNSLIKVRHLSDNMNKINGLKNTLKSENSDENTTYKRLDIIEQNIGAEIYRNNIGDNSILMKFLRGLKKLMILKSQSVFNVTGWGKNLTAGLLANYINSVNVPDNFIWNRLGEDVSSTMDGVKFALASSKGGIKGETFIQFIARTLNPQHRDIKELIRNSERWNYKNLIFDGKLLMSGMKAGETIISYQLLIDVTKRIEFLKEKNIVKEDGTEEKGFEYVKFMDIFEFKNEAWGIKEGIYSSKSGKLEYKDGKLDMSKVKQVDMSISTEVKALIDQGVLKTIGSNQYKGLIFNNSYVRSLFFFVNYLVPLMQDVIVTQRKDFIGNRLVDNYNVSLIKYFAKTLQYLGSSRWYWNYMTDGQKQNIVKGLATYASLYALVLIMRGLFGFNPKEKDAFKKLKDNSWAENYLIVVALKTSSEIEQLSLANPLSKTMFPVFTANFDAITNPTLVALLKQVGKTFELGVDEVEYDMGMNVDESQVTYSKEDLYHNVHVGDNKLLHSLEKYVPIPIVNDRYFNFPGNAKDIQNTNR